MPLVMKKSCFPLLVVLVLLITSCSTAEDTISFEAMNTFMTVRSFGLKSAKANAAAKKRILELEDTISTTKDCSEVWKINHANGSAIPISDDTKILADFSLKMATATNGALNPCLYPVIREWGFTTGEYKVPSKNVISELLKKTDYVNGIRITLNESEEPVLLTQDFSTHTISTFSLRLEPGMMIDFGAVGKGYAGDEAIKVLKESGIKSALLDLGGNIQALGSKTDGSDWTIGIKNPFDVKSGPVASVKIKDKAVITSGGYERYFVDEATKHTYIHIFDGKTGAPVENNVASVTIIADSGLYGDALSTSLVVLGVEKAINFWQVNKDFDFILMTKEGELYFTKGLKENLKLLVDFSKITEIQ